MLLQAAKPPFGGSLPFVRAREARGGRLHGFQPPGRGIRIDRFPPLVLPWEEGEGTARWRSVVDLLLNELAERLHSSLFLVLDDVHLLGEASEPVRILDWLIGRAPPDLHVVLSTRHPLSLPSLVTWRVRGEVLEIGERELAFTPEEIAILFREL